MVLVCVAKRDEPYKTIKRLLSCEFGVPSQFVQQEELVKNVCVGPCESWRTQTTRPVVILCVATSVPRTVCVS